MKVIQVQNATLAIAKTVLAKRGRVVLDEYLKRYRKNLANTATNHYRATGSAVKQQLATGFAGPEKSGSRIVSARAANGRPVRFRTGNWPKLTDSYRKSYPRSTRMWNKFGVLWHEVARDMPRVKMKAKVTVPGTQKLQSRAGRIQVIHAIHFPVFGNKSLPALLTKPFVHADESVAYGFKAFGLSRGTSDVLGYPEAAPRLGRSFKGVGPRGPVNRPWVAGLSGRLGREMHRAIRTVPSNTIVKLDRS